MDDLLEPPNLHDVKYDQYFSPFQFDSSADNLRVGCVIENDGTIEREVPDWRDSLFVSAEEGTRAAAQQGLTAGQISIEWHYLQYENEIEDNNSLYTTSGVCLERVWFLTTYGFLRLANEQGLAAMRHRGITGFYISTRRCSRYPELEKNMKHAYLAYYDRVQDIALFRLEDGDEFKHSVHLAQLGCPEMQPFDHVWSIGYVKRRDKEFEKFFNAFHEAHGFASDSPVERPEISSAMSNFEDIFHPGQRILVSGLVTGSGHVDGRPVLYHSMPGWHGIGGSQVGILRSSPLGIEVKIIGLFSGSQIPGEANTLVVFTPEIIETLAMYVQSEPRDQSEDTVQSEQNEQDEPHIKDELDNKIDLVPDQP